MLSRIIQGLSRPSQEEEEEDRYETASEGVVGSPPRGDGGHLTSPPDGGHLTARSSASGGAHSRRASALGDGDAPPAGSSAGASPAVEGSGLSARWGGVLGGVPFLPGLPARLVEFLSPRHTEDQEAAGEAEGGTAAGQGERPEPGGAAAAGGPPDLGRRSGPYPATQQQLEQEQQSQEQQAGGGMELGEAAQRDELAAAAEEAALAASTTPPAPLLPGNSPLPLLSEPSSLMSEEHIRALAATVPVRHRQARWTLLYSTLRDGISLHTLLRSCVGRAPTVLVVRDMGRHVFGAFCSEAWRPSATRYYGTGETFVFQLEPRQVAWFWWWQKMSRQRNDFFMFGGQDSIAVGGAGGYALWLDQDLSRGLSRSCITFGNESLASQEEFEVGAVELWCLS